MWVTVNLAGCLHLMSRLAVDGLLSWGQSDAFFYIKVPLKIVRYIQSTEFFAASLKFRKAHFSAPSKKVHVINSLMDHKK